VPDCVLEASESSGRQVFGLCLVVRLFWGRASSEASRGLLGVFLFSGEMDLRAVLAAMPAGTMRLAVRGRGER